MENFVLHNPTKIIFGKNTIPLIGPETTAFGTRVLLVYGSGSIKRNGVFAQVMDSLRTAGAVILEHGEVRSNPVLGHVHVGIEKVRRYGCEVICAAGGGSVIDTAKAIAAGAVVDHDVWKFFTGKKSLKNSLPLTCVSTLAASGSEMNPGMVLTREDTRQKFGFANRHLYPKVSILDPETTYTVPADYTAYGAVDALAHVLEFYCTAQQPAPVQQRLMEGLAMNAMEGCLQALRFPQNYEARANLMWTATLALNGLTAAGLGKVGFPMHLIEHSLSGLFDVPHGAGLAALMPGWLRFSAGRNPARLAQFGRRVFNLREDTEAGIAAAAIARIAEWLEEVGAPVDLAGLGIPDDHFGEIAAHAQALAGIWRMREYSEETIGTVLGLCRPEAQP